MNDKLERFTNHRVSVIIEGKEMCRGIMRRDVEGTYWVDGGLLRGERIRFDLAQGLAEAVVLMDSSSPETIVKSS